MQHYLENNLLISQNNNITGVYYGFMTFKLNHGNYIPNYHIISTSNHIDVIINHLKDYIINLYNQNKKENLLFYQVFDVNPNLVSYNIIKSSTYPYVVIQINNPKHFIIYKMNGHKTLRKAIYKQLEFLQNYDDYLQHLTHLNKHQMVKEYNTIFDKQPNFIFFSKSRMIKDLINNKKREFITNY